VCSVGIWSITATKGLSRQAKKAVSHSYYRYYSRARLHLLGRGMLGSSACEIERGNVGELAMPYIQTS
jgi:hypothetical protein